MKRLIFLFTAVLLLTGCGNDTPKDEVPKKESAVVEIKQKEAIDVTINVEPIVREDGQVYFEGETNLPDYAELMFTVTGPGAFRGQTKEVVLGGDFLTEAFSVKGEPLPSGEYELSISLSIPSTQDKKFTEVAGNDYEFLTGDLMDDDSTGKTMHYEMPFTIEQQKVEEAAKDDEKADENRPVDELKEVIEYIGIGEGDELVSLNIEGNEIKAVIKLEPDGLFPDKDIAVIRYSQITDELLDHKGWDVLTIEYVNVGTISMNRSEKESNEYGDYFPTEEIENRLK